MQPTRVMIHHSEPISQELPKRWTRHWKGILNRKAQAVYTTLRKDLFDGEMVDVRLLAAELLMSRSAFWTALKQLEEYGFVAVDEGMD